MLRFRSKIPPPDASEVLEIGVGWQIASFEIILKFETPMPKAKFRPFDLSADARLLTSPGLIGWIAVAIAAAILAFQLLAPPPIGLADNGDFAKITGRFNLYPSEVSLSDSAFRYVTLHYDLSPDNHIETGHHSSEVLLIEAALWLNRVVSRPGVFDLRTMGIVHAALFLLAFALFATLVSGLRVRVQISLLALAVLVFCDVTFSAYYNSFYLDAGAFVFQTLSIVMLLRATMRRRPGDTYLAIAFCLLLVTVKSQHALLAVPLTMFLVWQRHGLWPRHGILASVLAAAFVVGTGAYSLVEGNPSGYTSPCLFNIIFAKLLPTARDSSAELASLGLDHSFLRYAEMDAYMDRSPMRDPRWVQSFVAKTSFGRLCSFYLAHPGRAFQVARLSLGEAARGRPAEIGNYDRSAGHPPYAQSNGFSIWSRARRALLSRFLWAYPLIFAISLCIIAYKCPAGAAALLLMGLIEFGLGAMTDALEVTRHLFLFNTIWDVTLFAAVCALAVGRPGPSQAGTLDPAELVATE